MLEDFFALAAGSRLQFLPNPFPEPVSIRLFLKRDDELHPNVSGNKWRKLKYNLLEASRLSQNTLLTYGGAFSNHIYAVASAGKVFGFQTIGIIRGEDHRERDTPTLAYAREQGMRLHFVTREQFRRKDEAPFLADLRQSFGDFYNLPEGGTNELAVRGVAEVIPEIRAQLGAAPDYICCPVGTGGTLAGLVAGAAEPTRVIGFAALKGVTPTDSLQTAYHFGGYARTKPELIDFIRLFKRQNGILLEQVYTGKMLYGIYDLARQGYFQPGSTVVALHTGGLQGRNAALLD
ncbi:1-aminocyclopropane-1-carboxylate deaminase/D-cysteine desulfhydrase [Tellurirhabdus bombi]|uniref:1-aminocyclopropane-1-carboxylate deaminase/D-cysteine desulfhydrase n=1 Tax=Tellurirhabdus bombi TaxID=2907205 RepID=UPI001F2357A4|nr:pyridoxal-phosphate dependent enzyme [Tellurirhabdus bombi]